MPAPALPRLVLLEPRRITLEDGSEAVALHDPLGIIEQDVALSPAAWWLAAHLDGRHRPDEVAALARARGLVVEDAEVTTLVDALLRVGYVEGPRHDELRRAALASFREGGVRPASCAGGVYPDAPGPLRVALDGWLSAAAVRAAPAPATPTLLVAPHIDYTRGATGYAHAYRALAACAADLFVVFGTGHSGPARLFTLTRLDHGTPLGPVRTDRPVADALVDALGEEELLGEELHHRGEHSIELQLVMLAHVIRRPFTVLPVLCGSISHLERPAPRVARFLTALGAAVRGRRVCYVAGADLAHVGPLYGDARAPSPEELAALAAEDRRTLGHLAAGDPEAFHRDAIRDDARRRICGTAPIYAAMKASGVGASLLHYGQWTDGTDSVSYAAAAG